MVTGYSLATYGAMVEDKVRMTAYFEAMKRCIQPGSVVVEIGSGPGVMALLACQLGAARVYAIEPDPSIEIARTLAADNGYADRIVFLRKLSTEVDLPEKADVLLSDLRGQLPLMESHISSIRDARSRLIKPGAQQLSQRDQLIVGLSRNDRHYESLSRPWSANDYGLDLKAGLRFAIHEARGVDKQTTTSLGQGKGWAIIDYRTVESPNVAGSVEFELPVGERINGLELWFEAEVADGIFYSTGPDQPDQVYGRRWLPLEHPIEAAEGEKAIVRLAMNLVDRGYVTRWAVDVVSASGEVRQQSKQSSLGTLILSASELRRLDPAYAPSPQTKTKVAQFVLARFDGQTEVGNIAEGVRAAFPEAFKSDAEAIDAVRDLARRFCPDL